MMKKTVVMITYLIVLLLSACGNEVVTTQLEDNEYSYGEISMLMIYQTFEEALTRSTEVVVAQFVERRPFGETMEELEFVVSEQIFGNTADRIFVYIQNANISVMETSLLLNENDVFFEQGVDYLLPLVRLDRFHVMTNFHEDGYFLTGGSPIINLDNPIASTMYNEPIMEHANEIDFRRRSLSRAEIIDFAYETTRNNPLAPEMGDFIRSNNIEDIVNESSDILVIEINDYVRSINDGIESTSRYSVSVIENLKGEWGVNYNSFEMNFFIDTVRIGERHIVAIRPGTSAHPATGIWFNRFTSRNSLFSLDQQAEIEEIIAHASKITYDSNLDSTYFEAKERIIAIDKNLWQNVEELTNRATDIIRGEVLEQRVEWQNLTLPREVVERLLAEEQLTEGEIETLTLAIEEELVTVSRIRILEVFQGNYNVGDVIEIMQLGGTDVAEDWIIEDALTLEVSSEFVLFLVSWEMIDQPYSMINHVQGAYQIPIELEEGDYLANLDDWYVELKNVNELDPVIMTVEDLIKIALENDL